jgi:hypothetical protein
MEFEEGRFLMSRLHCLMAGIVLSSNVVLFAGPGNATDQKDAWRPILPMHAYRELAKREIDRIQTLLKETPDIRALKRAEVGAVLVAALTMSIKGEVDTDALRGTHRAALRLAHALKNKEPLAVTRDLTAALANERPTPDSRTGGANWRSLLDTPTLMVQFLPKGEGGDGIHPDLQSIERLKGGKNGILEKIRYLSTNELTRAALENEARELELFGYRSAVIGSLTYQLVPAKMKPKKTAEEWRDLATQMRDYSVALAAGAQKRDTSSVLQASTRLRSACSRCHNAF